MGDKAKVNVAVGILSFTGALIIIGMFVHSFQVPPELWGLATGASVFLFSSARDHKDDDA